MQLAQERAVHLLSCGGSTALVCVESVDIKQVRKESASEGKLVMAVDLTPRFRRLNSQTRSFREAIQHGKIRCVFTLTQGDNGNRSLHEQSRMNTSL